MEGPIQRLSCRNYWFFSFTSWKSKYALLQDSKLQLYTDQRCVANKEHLIVNIDHFDRIDSLADLPETTFNFPTKLISRKHPHIFVLFNSDQPKVKHVFSTTNETEMRNWIGALQSAMRGIRRKSKKHQTQEEIAAALEAAQAEFNEAIPIENPLPVITKQRPKGPAGRRLPARFQPKTTQSNTSTSDSDPTFTLTPQTSPTNESKRRLSGLCGQSLDSVGSLSFRSGKCSHDSGLGVDTPNALDDRTDVASSPSSQLNAIELAARLSTELLNRTSNQSPSIRLPSKVRQSTSRARSSSLDLIDDCNVKLPLSSSIDALESVLAKSPDDLQQTVADHKEKCSCKRFGQCSRGRRLLFFLRSKHKCKSMNELSDSSEHILISSNKIENDLNQSDGVQINRGRFCVQLQPIDTRSSVECDINLDSLQPVESNLCKPQTSDSINPSTSNLDRLLQSTQNGLQSIVCNSIDLKENSLLQRKESQTSTSKSIDRVSIDSIHIDCPNESEEFSCDVLGGSVCPNQTERRRSQASESNSSNDFRQQFLQRKALFEAQGKRHSLDLLDQRLSTASELTSTRPKSYGEAN